MQCRPVTVGMTISYVRPSQPYTVESLSSAANRPRRSTSAPAVSPVICTYSARSSRTAKNCVCSAQAPNTPTPEPAAEPEAMAVMPRLQLYGR